MKRLSAFLLALMLCFSCVVLAACGAKGSVPNSSDVLECIKADLLSLGYDAEDYEDISVENRLYNEDTPNVCAVEYKIVWEGSLSENYYAFLKLDGSDSKWCVAGNTFVKGDKEYYSVPEDNEVSTEDVKQAVIDYYGNLPFQDNYAGYRDETVGVEYDDWAFIEVKELEDNKFRVNGTCNRYECDKYGERWIYPDQIIFDKYVTYYPGSGNYDVSQVN